MKILRIFILLLGVLPFNLLSSKENYQETYNMVRGREEGDKGNYFKAKEFLKKEIK